MKKIAVLIPCYNNQKGLEKTLNSILPEKDLVDVFVVDDGSSTPLAIAGFESFVKILRLPKNLGITCALNDGLRLIFQSSYKYIARLDTGDMAINNRFTKQQEFLDKNPEYGLVGSNARFFNEPSGASFIYKVPSSDEDIRKKMHLKMCFVHPAMMFGVNLAKEAGFYDEKYGSAEDYEYFFRMLKSTKAHNIQEPLVDYDYADPLSISNSRKLEQRINSLRIKLKYFVWLNVYSYLGIIRSILGILTACISGRN